MSVNIYRASQDALQTIAGNAVGQIIQKSIMPTAALSELGNIYQYVGATSNDYINGYFYKCTVDNNVYAWERVNTQPEKGNIFRTTTALVDAATTNPIVVNGQNVTVASGDFAIYNTQEFLFDGTQWNLLGDRVGLGTLAYKDTASGTALVNAGTLPSLTYDSTNERLIFNAGTLPTKGTVTVS